MSATERPGEPGPWPDPAEQLIERLSDALFAQSLGHAGATRRHEQLVALRSALAALGPEPVQVELDCTPIRVDRRSLPGASLRTGRLRRLAGERGIRVLELHAEVTLDELGRALDLLGATPPRPLAVDADQLRDLHRQHGLRHVALRSTPAPGAEALAAGDSAGSLDHLQNLTSQVEDNHLAAARGDDLLLDETRSVVERAAAALEQRPSELLGLATYDDIDRFTVGHSVRVALLAMHTARAAEVDEQHLQLVGTAALLHDIGKSLVPAHVLFKRGRLDAEEQAAMQQHPRLGAGILVAQQRIDDAVVGTAFCHHMRPDGSGYPAALMPFRPGSVSNLIRVCDVFEALTAVRPYKRGMAPAEALTIMRRDPAEFDQGWLRFFATTIGPFPVGSTVELEDGTLAQVLELAPCHADGRRAWDRPRVLLPDGTEHDLGNEGPRVVRPALPGALAALG